MLATLNDIPEEILERILALVLVQSTDPSPRPTWHPYQAHSPTHSSSAYPTIISPLLVSRSWLRIATPIHYRHPVLRTPRHVELLLRAVKHTPALALCIRSVHVHATSPALRDLMPYCRNLDTLDITVDNADAGLTTATTCAVPAREPVREGARDRNVIEFCEAFARTRSVRHLVIRKNAYLTQPNAIYVFEQLALAIPCWRKLETVNVAFRLSPSPAATALVKALVAAPRLHTLYTHLPSVWNNTLLEIAENARLGRIVLSPPPSQAGAHLWVAQARAHPRLMDLVHAGTPPPPMPHPAAFANARARAASAATGPMPVATWGYERDVPAPACPPSRAPGGLPAHAPSAYGYTPAVAASYPSAGRQYAGYAPQQVVNAPVYRAPQQPSSYYQGAQYAPQGLSPYASGGAVPAQPRRNTPGGRRMTAA